MIPATPGPKISENGPEPEFRPEFLRNSEPSVTVRSAAVVAICRSYCDCVQLLLVAGSKLYQHMCLE
jgi:hypothetical protein